ncbi:MAG TPA: alanine--tRNA ligase [Flavobacteriales bacterium]|jgi:alanyl-tRNA synthetase|nr:alanine--tRNA ligase [Flavobacteriales bacterium]
MEWKTQKIRDTFYSYFKEKEHKIVPSAPLVIKNDPTLMFTNAGMNQFKDIFLGNMVGASSRIANSQKCLRVSGKHNDLEEVGVDTYHHTMFEMLGNWSFGDYFKKEAIAWAWELLTEVYGISPDQLYITVFGGDKEDTLKADTEARSYWAEFVPQERIIDFGKKDNFWEMGETGPCGPSSEIHVDIRSEEERKTIPAIDLINKDHPQVVEIWNLVFIQYSRQSDGKLNQLPQRHIDTGMGLERLAMVLQHKQSNYDIDLFRDLIRAIGEFTEQRYTATDSRADIAFRVVADHLRAVAFAIADGQMPSNTGAGYVIRRILRRAVRYAYSFLEIRSAFMYKLVHELDKLMGESYPEISNQKEFIENIIREEEESFLRTLENGLTRIEAYLESNKKVDGGFAFELYDTYGFPLDLTRLIAGERSAEIDEKGFEKALMEQKERSRKATKLETGDWSQLADVSLSEFTGYDECSTDVSITRCRTVKQKDKQIFQLVFNRTPFYPEGGGQVGDTGFIESDEEHIEILDTRKENDLIIHFADKLPQYPEKKFRAEVNQTNRILTAYNHTATHLLHHALREILGNHVEQKGSMVNEHYLRFDFSHFRKVSSDELVTIERRVNELIRANLPLDEHRSIPKSEADQMGAISLFGEKYGEQVRVIRFGNSVEFCGGTHVQATGQIGFFKIISESAIAAGIRRVEALTAEQAENYVYRQIGILDSLRDVLKNPGNIKKSLSDLVSQNKQLEKQIGKYQDERLINTKYLIVEEFEDINGLRFGARDVDVHPEQMKKLAFMLRKEETGFLAVLTTRSESKVILTIVMSDDVAERGFNANSMIKEISPIIKGGGGGQPFLATAGGGNPSGMEEAMLKVRSLVMDFQPA